MRLQIACTDSVHPRRIVSSDSVIDWYSICESCLWWLMLLMVFLCVPTLFLPVVELRILILQSSVQSICVSQVHITSLLAHLQEEIAVFMRHSPDVHKRIYQLPQGEVQKYSITKCLYQMNFGKEVNLDEIVRQGVGNVEDSAVVEYSERCLWWLMLLMVFLCVPTLFLPVVELRILILQSSVQSICVSQVHSMC